MISAFVFLFNNQYSGVYRNNILDDMFKKIEKMKAWVLVSARNKKMIFDVTELTRDFLNDVKDYIWWAIQNTIVIIWMVWVLSYINIWILPIILFSAALIYSIDKVIQRLSMKYELSCGYELGHKVAFLGYEFRRNSSDLIMAGGFPMLRNAVKDSNEKIVSNTFKEWKGTLWLWVLRYLVENFSEIWIKLIIWYSIFAGGASIWDMTLWILYISRIEGIVREVMSLRFSIANTIDNLKKVDLFLDLSEIAKGKRENISSIENINIENLNFSYPKFAEIEIKYLKILEDRLERLWENMKGGEEYDDTLHYIQEAKDDLKAEAPVILKDANLNFEKWKVYWVVGKNWAWKSTLVSLMMWFFDNYSWSIKINWKESKTLTNESFYKTFSILSQSPYIVSYITIRENLMMWVDREYSDEEIYKYLAIYGLEKKIKKLRKWLDTDVGHDVDFSGGEKQLLCIVRLLLQDRDVLILDEWTNQLDAENEDLVMQKLLEHKKDKIVIFITHRMSTMKNADMIYCLENGETRHNWTHKELLEGDNAYSRFYKKQVL